MYSIQYYSLSQISALKKDWEQMEWGQDMTYFQRYNWYVMLSELNSTTQSKRFEFVYAVVDNDGEPVVIAPFWIVKKNFGKYNKRGVYFFGRAQWSDYLNLIYKDFDGNAVEYLLEEIYKKYDVGNFIFEDVPKNSEFSKYVSMHYPQQYDNKCICVKLTIPESVEEYHKKLSKNARQNIRTAFNRAEKDGISFTFCFDDKCVDLKAFGRYREVRLGNKIKKGGTTLKSKFVYYISSRLLRRGPYEYKPYTPYTHDKEAHFITCKDQNGILCAGFCYGIDKVHNQIVLMAVATNPDYYKYSPGILCIYRFVLEQIENGGYDKIDFTRGNEKYKYVLGGTEHFNQRLIFDII